MSMIHATPAPVQPSPIRLMSDAEFRAFRQAEADRLLVDDGATEDEYRPTASDRYEPSHSEAAEWLGYSLAASGENPEPPAELVHWIDLEQFYLGRLLGEVTAERERIMRDWAIDAAMADELAREVHECERRGVC